MNKNGLSENNYFKKNVFGSSAGRDVANKTYLINMYNYCQDDNIFCNELSSSSLCLESLRFEIILGRRSSELVALSKALLMANIF
jgi:hypothetical protein